MVKRALAFSLLYVFSSYSMQDSDSLSISREDIIIEVALASKENRAPSPLVTENIEAAIATVLSHEDPELAYDMANSTRHFKMVTLLRMSDPCLLAIRSNVLECRSNTAPMVLLQTVQKQLQTKNGEIDKLVPHDSY